MNAISDDLIGQRTRRIQKVDQLRELGIDPYPSKAQKDYSNEEIIVHFSQHEGEEIALAGRLVSFRDHGKIMFGKILDQSGKIQLFFKKDFLKEDLSRGFLGWGNRKLLDMGDIVEAHGTVIKTSTGEISLQVKHIRIISKSIRPLPTTLHDKETIFRKRYLDLILNPENKWRFEKTAQITFAIREFLNHKGFLEIKTPILQPICGGTSANPFMTHVNALDVDFSMAISHELYLKRLITAGFENVYNIFGYFRNEGIDRSHNPEFTMLETMTAYKNYEYNMDLIEELYQYICEKVFNKSKFVIKGQEVDFSQRWERIKMIDAVKKYAGYDFETIKSLQAAHNILNDLKVEEKPDSIGECMVKVFEERVEEQLIQPTFITNHPVEISPLAKSCADDPRFVERFEIFIGGMEGGDNWTELNDPQDLFQRFKKQSEKLAAGDEEAHRMDLEFIEMMEYGMPPTTGLGPGIERLAMMLTETEYIDDVIFFPLMKPNPISKQQEEIYGLKNEQKDVKNKEQKQSES
jgi:lysyl-tRNA synthetase class 2